MASSVIKEMLLTCKLGPFLCLPENGGFDEFERVAKVNSPKGEDGPLAAAPSTLLSALFNKMEDVERFQVFWFIWRIVKLEGNIWGKCFDLKKSQTSLPPNPEIFVL